MKLNKWLYGAAALAMLAACSDKDIAPATGGGDDDWGSFKGELGYLGLSLELPSELETRAGDEGDQGNDNFDDGLSAEYNVKNAALLLFVGDSESTAQFCGAYSLVPDESFEQPSGDNITVSFHKAARVKNPAALKSTGQLWGLALVNYDKDHFKIVSQIEDANYGNLSIRSINNDGDEEEITVTRKTVGADGNGGVAGMTFGDVRKLITDCTFRKYKSGGALDQIFMTNAPLSSVKGTIVPPNGFKIQTLAKLGVSQLKENELEALQNPAGCSFVERALAKITCSDFPTSVRFKRTKVTNYDGGTAKYEDENVDLTIESVEWMLDNEEQNSYIIRNTTDLNTNVWSLSTNNFNGNYKYRFIGSIGMNDYVYDSNPEHASGDNVSTWYRTYWCVDPNYSTDKEFNDQANADGASFNALYKNNNLTDDILYAHENTFTVANQNYKNTTRVVFKVKYAKAGDNGFQMYAIRGQLRSFYLKEDAENLFKRTILGSSTLNDLIKDLMKDGTTSLPYTANDFTIECGNASSTYAEAHDGVSEGDYIVTKITMNKGLTDQLDMTKKTSEYIAQQLAEIADDANSANHIVPFTDNTCYYAAYIQHFGVTYCPLPDEVTPAVKWTGSTTDVVYGTDDNANAKYLGRYGLVRNNWYDLNVTEIGSLGRATVPNGNAETSDDNQEEEYYISARVHVLSWAKRTQKVKF